jgi:hypothetical protein
MTLTRDGRLHGHFVCCARVDKQILGILKPELLYCGAMHRQPSCCRELPLEVVRQPRSGQRRCNWRMCHLDSARTAIVRPHPACDLRFEIEGAFQ